MPQAQVKLDPEAVRHELFAAITKAHNMGVEPMEIYNHLSTLGDVAATPDEARAASEAHCGDEISIDNGAWASRGDDGFWVHAWVWVDKPEQTGE